MTEQQVKALRQLPTAQLVAEPAGRSKAVIVRLSNGRLYYLSPGGLLRRCR